MTMDMGGDEYGVGQGFDVAGGGKGRCGVIVCVFCSLAMYVALVFSLVAVYGVEVCY